MNLFTCSYHGVDKALIAISQVGRQPPRRLVNGSVRPLSVWKVQRLEALVLLRGVLEPKSVLVSLAVHVPEALRREGSYIGILLDGGV